MFEELKCYLMDGLTLSQTIGMIRLLAEIAPEHESDTRKLIEKLMNMEELTGYAMGDMMTDEEMWEAIRELENDLPTTEGCDLPQLLHGAGLKLSRPDNPNSPKK